MAIKFTKKQLIHSPLYRTNYTQVNYIRNTLYSYCEGINIDGFELEILVKSKNLLRVLFFLRHDVLLQYHTLTDIIASDFLGKKKRFLLTYHLLSVFNNTRIRVTTTTDELLPVPSVVRLFYVSNWQEREIWDLYGIRFHNHPDLRRLLTDYGFKGHPLRKDFPLTGYVELVYNDSKKRVTYVKVTLAQEYRNFKFSNPWKKIPVWKRNPILENL